MGGRSCLPTRSSTLNCTKEKKPWDATRQSGDRLWRHPDCRVGRSGPDGIGVTSARRGHSIHRMTELGIERLAKIGDHEDKWLIVAAEGGPSRSMQIKAAAFITSASTVEECPRWDYPEFSFIGRSNVGKSSMINLLSERHSLAKVSATPGKTRLLNFFLINDSWSLVDLPGYGFAKAAKTETLRFNELICDYLERANVRHLFVLIDSRLGPQRIDVSFLSWLGGAGVSFSLIFTKADKQSTAKTQAGVDLFLETISPLIPVRPNVFISSAKTRTGRAEILGSIARHLRPCSG